MTVMTKEDFKRRWEKDVNGDGITNNDCADCAKAWGISDHPFSQPIHEIVNAVVAVVGVSVMNPLMFHDHRVVANPNLTNAETREVKRTRKERLFTRPWRPLKVMRTEPYLVPSRDALVDKMSQMIYAHPVVVKEIEAAIEKSERVSRAETMFGFALTMRVDPLWKRPIA